MSDQIQANIIFKGRVQGVGFRFMVEEIALNHSLTGWVKNLANGDVQAIAQGSRHSIEAALETIRNSRLGNHVSKVKVQWVPCEDCFDDFTIEYDI